MATETCFLVLVRSAGEEARARVLIESLRDFGGRLASRPVWVLVPDTTQVLPSFADLREVVSVPFAVDPALRDTYFASKVTACAVAEAVAPAAVGTLVWLDPQCLILNPPELFELDLAVDAAFRPVHIRNIGSPAGEPMDDFWGAVYQAVGLEDAGYTVASSVDAQMIRPYYNTHAFAWNPAAGLATRWLDCFGTLAEDRAFRDGPCRDELHHIFLHQAVLSALVTKRLTGERLRVLPPEYSYPLHLHRETPPARRAETLNDLVCAVYEEDFPAPDTLQEIVVEEPLRSWLVKRHTAPAAGA